MTLLLNEFVRRRITPHDTAKTMVMYIGGIDIFTDASSYANVIVVKVRNQRPRKNGHIREEEKIIKGRRKSWCNAIGKVKSGMSWCNDKSKDSDQGAVWHCRIRG